MKAKYVNREPAEYVALETILKMKPHPQAQYDLNRQLELLIIVANKLGLYDAADYLRNTIEK